MIKKIAFVSFRSKDTAADQRFFHEQLGLPITASHEHDNLKWIEFDTPDGKTIAIEEFSPEGNPPTLALETDDIAAEVARLKELGVPFHGDIQDNKVCKMAFTQTPSGHPIMLHEIAPERAKG